MNDKDKEAFDDWFNNFQSVSHTKHDCFSGWQAAIDYKQKEIDSIMSENQLCERFITQIQADKFEIHEEIKKLEAENSKLRKCVEFYASTSSWECHGKVALEDQEYIEKWSETIGGKQARQLLKELEG